MKRYFALMYYVDNDFSQKRGPYRQAHLEKVFEAHRRGDIVHAGALGDPPDRALLVFRAEDRGVAESFAKVDPYVTSGLVKTWEVQPWAVVCGLREDDFDPVAGLVTK